MNRPLTHTALALLLAAGETMDVLVTPTRAGELVLEVTSFSGPGVITRVPVRVRRRWSRRSDPHALR